VFHTSRRRRFTSLLASSAVVALTLAGGLIGQPLSAAAAPPNGPATGLRVTSTASGSAELAWNAATWGASANLTYTVLVGGSPFAGCLDTTNLTCHVTGAAASTVTLSVRANGDGPNEYLDSGTVITTLLPPPLAPTSVAVSSTGSGQGTVSWTAPASWRLSSTKKYDVIVDSNVVSCHDLLFTITTCAITGAAGPHTVVVRAIGNTGLATDSSTANFSLVVAPDAPTNLHLTASDVGSGTLEWTPPAWNGNVHHGYTVKVDGNPVDGCVDISTPSCTFTADAITVGATVTAIGDAPALAAQSGQVTLTLLPAPNAPPSVRAAEWIVGGAAVLWDPASFNGSTINTYTVLTDGNAVAGCIGITATRCAITGTPDSTTSVVVRANGDNGLATSASPLVVELPELPGAPTTLGVTSRTLGHTVIGWAAPASWHNNAQRHYSVLVDGVPVGACTAITELTCDITGHADTTGTVIVRAIGNSAVLHSDATLSVDIPDVPDPATNVRITATTNGNADIAWDPPADWKHNTNQTYAVTVNDVPVGCADATLPACHITGSGTVSVKVIAVGDHAGSLSSDPSTALPVALIAVPTGDVGTVTVTTAAGNPVVTVTWDSLIDGAGSWSGGTTEEYAVHIVGPPGAILNPNGCAVPVTALTCSFTTNADGEYIVTVTAVNEAGPSTTSAQDSSTLVLHAPTGPVQGVLVDTTPASGSVTVTWTALATEAWHGATDRKYQVTLDSPVGAVVDPGTCTPPMTATPMPTCTFTTNLAGQYTAHVKAVSEAGISAQDATDMGTVALVVPAAAVTGLNATATVGTGAVEVTWTGISDADWQGEDRHYQVDITGGTTTDLSCAALATGANTDSATGCSFTATTAGTYTVEVTAFNEVGDSLVSLSDTVHVTLAAPDGPVTGLDVVTSAGSSTVAVNWDQLPTPDWKDATDREYLVTITRPDGAAVAANSCTTAPIADSSTPDCSFTAASAGTYTVDVVARSEAGSSAAAQATGHVTLVVPSGAVSDATVTTTLDSDNVVVSWPRLTGNSAWSEGVTRTYKVTLTDANGLTSTPCPSVADGPTPSCSFANSTPGPFTVEVIAVNEVGPAASGPTEVGAIVRKPTALVADLTAAQTPGTATVQVAWTQQNPADWRGGTTNTYRVTVDGPAGSTLTPQNCTTADVADSATPTCYFTASIGGDYVVKVAPVNEAGLSTGTAVGVTAHVVRKPTATVTNLRALATNGFGDVVVLWNRANAAAFNGAVSTHDYVVTITKPSGAVLNPNTCTTVADGVAPNCTFTADTSGSYTVQVALANEAGTSENSTTNTVGLSLSAPTGKPSAVTVTTSPGSGTVAVGWTALDATEWEGQTHNYQVAIALPPGAAPLSQNGCVGAIADSATPQCSFVAASAGTYSVTVTAVNETGTSSQSTNGTGHVTLAVPTGPVTGLAAVAGTGSAVVSVSWNRLSDVGWQDAQQRTYLVTVDRPAGAGALTDDSCTAGPINDSVTPQCAFTVPAAGDYTVHVVPHNEVGNGTQAQATRHITLAVPSGTVADPTVTTLAGSGAVQVSWPQLTGDPAWSMGVTRTYKVTLTDANGLTTTPCPSVADGPMPSCSFTNSTPGPFTVEVFAVNEVGAALSGTTKPGGIALRPTAVVTGLTATQTPGSATVQVGWAQLGAIGWRGGSTKNYRVTVDGPPGAALTPQNCTTADVADSVSPGCSFTASIGGAFTVTVAPVTEADVSTGTAASVVAQVRLAPSATVSGLAVGTVPGSATVTASWGQAATAAWNGGVTKSYTVTVQSPSGAVLTGNSCTTVVDSSTPSCTFVTNKSGTYTVGVALTNEIGTATASASTGVVALGAPGSPTGVSGSAGTNAITVSWSAPANVGGGITSYTVTATAADYPAVTCPATVTVSPCTITGLAAGVEYTVSVAAAGPDGTSTASSGTTTVVPAGAPQAPAEVPSDAVPAGSATTTAGGSITITGGGFEPGSTVVLTLHSVPVSLGTTIAGPDGTINVTVSLPSGTALGSHTFLASGLDSEGVAVYLAKSVAVASTPPVVDPPVVNPPTAAVPPSGLVSSLAAKQTPGVSRAVLVTWTADQIAWGTGANHAYVVTVDGPGTRTGGSCSPSVSATTCTFTVNANGTYLVGVTARTDAGTSSAGATATVKVVGAPGVPSGIRGTAKVNSVVVSWNPGSGGTVSQYTATATATAYPARTCTVSGTSCTITGLAAGVAYTLRVAATGPAGTSAVATGGTRPVPSGNALVPTAVPASAGILGRATTVTAGARLTVTGTGYKAGSKVPISLFPGPVTLTTATASKSGAFSATVLVPRSTRAGQYRILATGLNAGGAARFLAQPLIVRAAAEASIRQAGSAVSTGGSDVAGAAVSARADGMPITGHATGPVALAGVLFILLGLSLTTAFRRRRRVR